MSAVAPTQFTGFDFDLDEIVDLDRYPIHHITNPSRSELVAETRAQMDAVGCCRIGDFLRPEAVASMLAEAEELADRTFWSVQSHNPYASPDDPTFPEGHPRRFFQQRESGFINSDVLTEQSLLRKFFDSDVVVHFISDCLGVAPIYRWSDPLGRNPYGVMEPDHYFPWHFDGNSFTVSLLVQKADRGGVFEYVPDIRSEGNENYERVQYVLEGGREGVHELDLVPGDLQIFKGRYSMHRVTRIEGTHKRIIALPCYVTDPWHMNSPHHSTNYYGRHLPIHELRHGARIDGLVD